MECVQNVLELFVLELKSQYLELSSCDTEEANGKREKILQFISMLSHTIEDAIQCLSRLRDQTQGGDWDAFSRYVSEKSCLEKTLEMLSEIST